MTLSLRWRVMPPPITLRWRGPNLSPAGLPQVQQPSSASTIIGPPGRDGADGSGGSSGDDAQVFNQHTPATTWTVIHSFPRIPNVAVYDSTGRQVFPDITVINSVSILIEFSGASDGTAILT